MYLQMRQPETDHTLLQAFATRQCHRSFAELVERHGAMVYSAALRQVRRRDLADDVTQAVFVLLAERASSIQSNIILAAWLHKTCRYTALNALKLERRRSHHEQQAATMAHGTDKPAGWSNLWPILDESIEHLAEADRTAIVLRYLEQRSLADVGRQLGVSENAAGMRVSRALERLRGFFHRRGIGLSAENLGVVLSLQLPTTMPAPLATLVSSPSATSMVSIRAGELVACMNRELATQTAKSAFVALASAAAVFAVLCMAANWWVTPAIPPHRASIAVADAEPSPATRWLEVNSFARP